MQIYNNNNQKNPKNKKRFPEMLQIVHIQNQSERKRGEQHRWHNDNWFGIQFEKLNKNKYK